jgi:hypothetical protein
MLNENNAKYNDKAPSIVATSPPRSSAEPQDDPFDPRNTAHNNNAPTQDLYQKTINARNANHDTHYVAPPIVAMSLPRSPAECSVDPAHPRNSAL